MAARRKGKKRTKKPSASSPAGVMQAVPALGDRKAAAPPSRVVPIPLPATTGKPVAVSVVPRRSHNREIPSMYNETYLRVLPMEEGRLFSFWEIAPLTVRSSKKKAPQGLQTTTTGLLHLYEVMHLEDGKTGRVLVETLPTGEGVTSRYIDVPPGRRTFEAELSIQDRSGSREVVCRSGAVVMPSGRVREKRPDQDFHADTPALTNLSLEGTAFTNDTVATGSQTSLPRTAAVTSPQSSWCRVTPQQADKP